jgi:hypothetical protein
MASSVTGWFKRSAQFFPVGQQFGQRLGVHDGAGQNVRAGLGTFFQHHHRNILAFFSGQLLEANRRGQAARATTDDDDVVFHGFTGAKLRDDFVVGHVLSRLIMGRR